MDFLVIGTQKAGTTALFEYLRRHPQLTLPAGKEVPFYSHDAIWQQGWEPYARAHFARAPEGTLWGTVSPSYMMGAPYDPPAPVPDPEPVVPRRIHAHAPDAKLVAVLREPVGRAYSHHRMQLMDGGETRPFAVAVAESLEPAALDAARHRPGGANSYVVLGEYGRILAPYVELFGRERLLVLWHGDLIARPEESVRRVFAFLGVDERFVPDNLGERYRVGAARRRIASLDPNAAMARAAGMAPLRGAWRALPPGVRLRLLHGYKELAYRIDLRNRAGTAEGPPADEDAAARERLRAHFADDRAALAAVLAAEPPW